MFNRTTLHSCHVCCISWTYLNKQQMSELPFMTVFQSFYWWNHVMNGNWLIFWTPALSCYTTAQLMCWHVI